MLLGIALTLVWVQQRYGRTALDLSLAQPPERPGQKNSQSADEDEQPQEAAG